MIILLSSHAVSELNGPMSILTWRFQKLPLVWIWRDCNLGPEHLNVQSSHAVYESIKHNSTTWRLKLWTICCAKRIYCVKIYDTKRCDTTHCNLMWSKFVDQKSVHISLSLYFYTIPGAFEWCSRDWKYKQIYENPVWNQFPVEFEQRSQERKH